MNIEDSKIETQDSYREMENKETDINNEPKDIKEKEEEIIENESNSKKTTETDLTYFDSEEKEERNLSIKDFPFLDEKDPISIAIAFFFIYLRTFSRYGMPIPKNGIGRLTDKQTFNNIMKSKNAYNPKHMLELFLEFNNKLNASDSQIKDNASHIAEAYEKCISEDKFKWLEPKNDEQAQWVKNYILNKKLIKKVPSILQKERYFHITTPALVYSLDISDAERELFILKIKQAWGQVKYRNKIKKEKKVSFNLVIDESTKKNLKKLAQAYERTMNETIEILINAAAEANSSKPIQNEQYERTSPLHKVL